MPSGLKTTLQNLDFVFFKRKKKEKPCSSKKQNKSSTPKTSDSFFLALLHLLSRGEMEIPAYAEFFRGGRGLAIGSTSPLLWKPNKQSVYLLAYED